MISINEWFKIKGALINMTSDKILAYDQDIGINMTLKYSLVSNPGKLILEHV